MLISIDTLRADHLGSYGYARDTSPRLDAFAAESTRFARAYAASYHTADSHMSVFTALHPSVHGVRNTRSASEARPLTAAVVTLPERLAAGGLRTFGYHAGGNVSPAYGFGRGFEEYRGTGSEVQPAIDRLADLASRPAERFFLFFHTYRPHDPYLPAAPYNELWEKEYAGPVLGSQEAFDAQLAEGEDFAEKRRLFWSRIDPEVPADLRKAIALYDGEIRQTDDEIGRLLDQIDRMPQRVLVAVMSDHGEEFHEHGRFLHDQLYDEVLHVPLMIRHPDRVLAGQVVDAPVGLVALAPTLLDLAGIQGFEAPQAASLRALMEGGATAAPAPVLAEKIVTLEEDGATPRLHHRALISRHLKLLSLGQRGELLFDLELDPREREDLAAIRPDDRVRLAGALARIAARNDQRRLELRDRDAPGRTEIDAEMVEQLKALGYL